ncbi:hypothetical protein BFW01_g9285 [Lasiodiplodia theobromae]|nr:hypothetical protein BFW01_g9285 [Lasiodiplodia theobromae]
MARRQGLEDATGDQIKSTAATPYGACLGVLGAGSYPQPGSPPRYTHEHAKFRTQPCLLHPPTPHAQVLLHTFSPSKLRPPRPESLRSPSALLNEAPPVRRCACCALPRRPSLPVGALDAASCAQGSLRSQTPPGR